MRFMMRSAMSVVPSFVMSFSLGFPMSCVVLWACFEEFHDRMRAEENITVRSAY
jgi:hypothetical protein